MVPAKLRDTVQKEEKAAEVEPPNLQEGKKSKKSIRQRLSAS
jgi:hypothetical protein